MNGGTHSTTKDMITTCVVSTERVESWSVRNVVTWIATKFKLCDVDQQTCDDDERLALTKPGFHVSEHANKLTRLTAYCPISNSFWNISDHSPSRYLSYWRCKLQVAAVYYFTFFISHDSTSQPDLRILEQDWKRRMSCICIQFMLLMHLMASMRKDSSNT
jgi:hypothetical protein